MSEAYKFSDHPDPFSTDRSTRLIHFNSDDGFSSLEKAAMLSRYSRSTKSMLDLITTEFSDKKHAPAFITKLLSEYGDDSIAELASETIGIEGLSIIAASKLTDNRIGISFIEKSTRYVPFSPDSFYIPEKLYELGLVDEFKDLCGLSYRTFNKIFNSLSDIFKINHDVNKYMFFDSEKQKEVAFDKLTVTQDINNAIKAHNRAIKDKAFDIAGYSWLTSLKTNIGFNCNARALEYLITKSKQSTIPELNNLSDNLYTLLSQSIEPFIVRTKSIEGVDNKFNIYGKEPSVISLYKHNIATLIRSFDNFDKNMNSSYYDEEEEEEEEDINEPRPELRTNTNLVKSLLTELALKGKNKNIHFKESTSDSIHIDSSNFEPGVSIVQFMDEQIAIDTLCSVILFENDENLLEYDEKNINNIDNSLRILGIDKSKVKSGILYDIINKHKTIKNIYENDTTVVPTSENTLKFEDLQGYWHENRNVNDTPIFQDYVDPTLFTLTKDQEYLINRYIGERKSRRNKLGRAFEMIDYMFEITSSFRIMREFKRHRLSSSIYPQLLTARNSYDSFIFPSSIMQDKDLFEIYKNLIDRSFVLYTKVAKKDYITAQYCLPLSTKCKYISKNNLRQLDYLLSIRTMPQVHPEFRDIAQSMYETLLIIHPNLAKLLSFVDPNEYSLGRMKSEYNSIHKIDRLNI